MKNKEEKQKKLEEIIKSKTYYGCAEDIYLTDKRRFRWLKEREKYGYDSTDLWSLDITIIKFMIPRLKDLISIRGDTFLNQDLFILEMNTVVKFFEIYLDFNYNNRAYLEIGAIGHIRHLTIACSKIIIALTKQYS